MSAPDAEQVWIDDDDRMSAGSRATDLVVYSDTVSPWALRPELLFLLSTMLYFVPLAIGGFDYVTSSGTRIYASYHPEVVPVVVAALALLAAVALFLPARRVRLETSMPDIGIGETSVLIVLIAVSGLYVLLTPDLFSANKADVLRATARGHSAFYNLCIIGVLYAALTGWHRHLALLAISVAGILLALYIGHRSTVALTLAGLLYVAFRNRSLISIPLRKAALALAGITILILYKTIYILVKKGDYSAAYDRLLDRPFVDNAVVGLEQFVTFAHLDFVVFYDFELDCSNLGLVPLSVLPFTDLLFDDGPCSYNSQVQPVFFAGYTGGVAANIWAEFYALFGYLGVPLLIGIVVLVCRLFEAAINRCASPVVKAGLILAIIHLTVYIQRNELLGAFVFAKRAILVAAIVWALARLLQPPELASVAARRRP